MQAGPKGLVNHNATATVEMGVVVFLGDCMPCSRDAMGGRLGPALQGMLDKGIFEQHGG